MCEHGTNVWEYWELLTGLKCWEENTGLGNLDLSYFALIAHNYVTFMEGLIVVLKTLDYYVRKLDYMFPQ